MKHYLVKNICDSIKNLRFVLLLFFSVSVCVLTMLFAYGVSRDYEIESHESPQMGFYIQFVPGKRANYYDKSEASVKKPAKTEVFLNILETLPDRLKSKMKSGTVSTEEKPYENEFMYFCIFDIKDGNVVPGYDDSGFASGRGFTDDEFRNSNNLAVGWDSLEADEVTIRGESYRVIGKLKSSDNQASTGDNARIVYVGTGSVMEYPMYNMQIIFDLVPSAAEKETIERAFADVTGEEYTLNISGGDEGIMGKAARAGFTVSVLIGIISAINTLIIFRLILEKRYSQFYSMRLCGAKKRDIRHLFLGEIMFFTSAAAMIIGLVYGCVLEPYLRRWYRYFPDIYNRNIYVLLLLIYYVSSMLICTAALWRPLNRVRSVCHE